MGSYFYYMILYMIQFVYKAFSVLIRVNVIYNTKRKHTGNVGKSPVNSNLMEIKSKCKS